MDDPDPKKGTYLGRLNIVSTQGGFQNLTPHYAELNDSAKTLKGFHTIYLVGGSSDAIGGIGTYDWIQFDNEPIPAE